MRAGDVVVMGNLACHNRVGVRRAIEAARVTAMPQESVWTN